MKRLAPSIFNDVIGPVMRGPSSSHTAAAARIGQLLNQFYKGEIKRVIVNFDPQGSLATTFQSQGSDIGLVGGLLGMDPADPGLIESIQTADQKGVKVEFTIEPFPTAHPNTYRITVFPSKGNSDQFLFVSTGGGMIELQEINGASTHIRGDSFETLLFIDKAHSKPCLYENCFLSELLTEPDEILLSSSEAFDLINIKHGLPLTPKEMKIVDTIPGVGKIVCLSPVLPVKSRKTIAVPFITASEITDRDIYKDQPLATLAIQYERARSGFHEKEVLEYCRKLVQVMRNAVNEGLAGRPYEDRILGPQALKLNQFNGRLIGGGFNKRVITYITAIMETKSAMGVIVATPTAGSCGALPGALLAVADEWDLSEDEVAKGVLAAGLVGVFIAAQSTFAAEECGCQAECGSASGMTAAALVQMAGGNAEQALSAASIALQNTLGLICDPVANRVEVACLGKNILAGMNAIASADMILSGFDPIIPLDQTIAAQDQVGRMLPEALCCTGKAGLSVTPASQALAKKLARKEPDLKRFSSYEPGIPDGKPS